MNEEAYSRALDALKMVLETQQTAFAPIIPRESAGQQFAELCWGFMLTYQSHYQKEVQQSE